MIRGGGVGRGIMAGKGSSARRQVWVFALAGAIITAASVDPMNPSNSAAHAESSMAASGHSRGASPTPETLRELAGLDEQRAIELLGPAASIENRAPATVWHYASSRCELDLIFYMEMHSGQKRALHYAFRRGAETAAEQQTCLITMSQGDSKEVPALVEWPDLPEKNLSTEISVGNVPDPTPMAQTSSAPEPKAVRTAMRRHTYRSYRLPRHRNAWGYTVALRYSYPAYGDPALITGWGGGQFGPAPYSASQ